MDTRIMTLLSLFLIASSALLFAGMFRTLAQGELETCIDGTPDGKCSETVPLKCEMGILINNCAECGCPEIPESVCLDETSECCFPVPEQCNKKDDDCDGLVDEDYDYDQDGYFGKACEGVYPPEMIDCHESNPSVHPGADETCNRIDDDCDGVKDEDFDKDGDGFFDRKRCEHLYSYTYSGALYLYNDCDDGNPNINPGMPELCNGIDDNCDGLTDDFCDPCTTILDNGDPSRKLDIVYIGSGYTESEKDKLISDVMGFMNTLLSIEPFKSQKDKINVYMVYAKNDLGCSRGYAGVDRCLFCDSGLVWKAATQCPADKVVVIVNEDRYGGCATLGGNAHAYRSNAMVGVHEFGHSFGTLLDEYVYPEEEQAGQSYYIGKNCDKDPDCSQWSGLSGTGCYEGCTNSGWYRPKESNSIMIDASGDFNPVGERILKNILEGYS